MRRRLPLLILFLSTFQPALAGAGSVGVYFDPTSLTTERDIDPFVPFHWYVVAFDAEAKAFEFGVSAPAEILVLDRAVVEGADAVITEGDNFVLDLAECSVGNTTLVSYLGLVPNPTARLADARICVTSHSESTFVPARPGYTDCEGQDHPLGLAGGGCAVINPSPSVCLGIADEPLLSLRPGHGFPGGFAEMILRTGSTGDQDCTGPGLNVVRLSFDVQMDTSIGVLEALRVVEPTGSWVTSLEPGPSDTEFRVTLSSDEGVLVDGGEQLEVALGFQLSASPGSTRVYLTNIRYGFPSGEEMPDTGNYSASAAVLTSEPVSTSYESFGSVKARF